MSLKPDEIDLGESTQPLLQLPLSVLAPRRVDGTGRRRFGRSSDAATIPAPIESPAALPLPAAEPINTAPVESHKKIVFAYIAISILFQLCLLLPGLSTFRMPLRMFPFAASVALAFISPRSIHLRHRVHPSVTAAVVVLLITGFGLLNQDTQSMLAGVATIVFYMSILAPLIWAGRLQISEQGFTTILLILWSFNAMSASVGVLQVLYPGRFVGAVSTVVQAEKEDAGANLSINLANGEKTERPYGLTDTPGGAAGSGAFAFIFGLGLLSITRRPWLMLIYAGGMAAGLFVIYLCQVRLALVSCAIAVLGYLALLTWRTQFVLLSRVVVALAVIITVSTAAAWVIGGAETADRVMTLIAKDPESVYYGNRGVFLEATVYYWLPMFPVGAGLGRYGMMALYFGDRYNTSHNLWAEIQWTAWVYDGGWLMIIAYPVAILLAIWVTIRIAFDKSAGTTMNVWGTILSAYNLAAVAITFSYSIFISQAGLEFWMLNALMYAVYQYQKQLKKIEVPQGFEDLPQRWQPGVNGASLIPPSTPIPAIAGGGPGNVRKPLANRRRDPEIRAIIE